MIGGHRGTRVHGASRTITLTSGTLELDVRDAYSRWKDWVGLGDNSKWPVAFQAIGGETIDPNAGTTVPAFAFLVNGWRIRPQEADHTLAVSGGVLLVDGGGDPFLNTIGDFVVRVNYQQPVQAITVASSGGGGGLTPTQDARLSRVLALLEADELLEPSRARKFEAGTSNVLLDKTVSGGNLPGTVTLTETP
ncbi:MAG: hypothetical protein HC933_09720 [Pleurocapsa sp. SU_196_0]|nr:hypothetical protein [Pleurocapsa sp. SU_196_0]